MCRAKGSPTPSQRSGLTTLRATQKPPGSGKARTARRRSDKRRGWRRTSAPAVLSDVNAHGAAKSQKPFSVPRRCHLIGPEAHPWALPRKPVERRVLSVNRPDVWGLGPPAARTVGPKNVDVRVLAEVQKRFRHGLFYSKSLGCRTFCPECGTRKCFVDK